MADEIARTVSAAANGLASRAGTAAEPKPSVTLDAGAGKAEAELLVVGAMRKAARTIAQAVIAARPAAHEIIVLPGSNAPDFVALDRFESTLDHLSAAIDEALADADADARARRPAIVERGILAPLPAAVPALNLANKVVSGLATLTQSLAIRTRFAAIEVSGDDGVLCREIASAMLAVTPPVRVRLAPLRDRATIAALRDRLQDLATRGAAAAARADQIDGEAGAEDAAASRMSARLRAVAKAETDFREALGREGEDGPVPLDEIAAQLALRAALDREAVLLQASIVMSGAGQFTRQRPLGSIFRDPVCEISAAVVTGYSAYAGAALEIVACGNVRAPVAYRSLRDVPLDEDDTRTGIR